MVQKHNQRIKTQLSIIIKVWLTAEIRNVDSIIKSFYYSICIFFKLLLQTEVQKPVKAISLKKQDNSIIIGIILAWCNIRKEGRKKNIFNAKFSLETASFKDVSMKMKISFIKMEIRENFCHGNTSKIIKIPSH